MKSTLAFMILILAALLSHPAWCDIIPGNRTAPWQANVGVPGGIPMRTTIWKNIVTDLGADPTGVLDCTSIILGAIASCPAGQVIYIPAGTFRLNSRVYLTAKQNFTLRGAGQGITIIKAYNDGYFVFGSQQWPPPNTYIPITAGATKGSNTITVADTSGFIVDQPMNITTAVMPVWAHNLGGSPDSVRNLRIAFKVRSKTSTTVTFDPPCPFDFTGLNPQARTFLGPVSGYNFIQGIGIESLTMDMNNSTAGWAIELGQAWGCWVKDVEVKGAISRQMRFGTLVRGEVRHCYTHDKRGSGPNHEGIDFDGDCCWNLVEDNICNDGGASPIQFGDSTGANSCNVVAYNYVVNTDPAFWDISFNHNSHDMLNLAEGNVIDNYKDDGYFGSSSHNTLFRNRITQYLELKHFSNYYNIVGNVLGTTGFSNAYETTTVNYSNNPIYALGYPNIGNHGYAGTFGPTTPPNYSGNGPNLTDPENQTLDLNVKATILRHGNFDYFNNATVWDATIPDHTIPDSLFTTQAESIARGMIWGNLTFPPINPANPSAVTVDSIPAGYRFNHGTDPSGTPSPTPTATATVPPSPTPTPTPTSIPTVTPTPTPTPTAATPTPTETPTPTPTATATPPVSLVAAYNFNEGSGTTVNDASGNGITGNIIGATWTAEGRNGNALSFNGSSSYVDLGNPALLQVTGSMTWSAWVKAAANPADDGQIVAKSDDVSGWQLKTSPDTGPHTFGVRVAGATNTFARRYSTTVRSLNVWYHVAGVYNASARTLDIYVNGVLDNGTLSGIIPAVQINSAVNVNIGRRSGGFYFNGVIDDVRIYNRALSQTEIQDDMNTPVGTPAPTPTPTPTATPTATATSTPPATPIPDQCEVPNFIGLKFNHAQSTWNDAGFTTEVIILPRLDNPNYISWQSLPEGFIGSCSDTTIIVQ